ncbi:hypothetical protein AVEN_138295-1 [Araneus ventricosus]|uniref:Uncharacterized protein n=1 Tax=Araneus ventricosus TaxID=182803 RepID=A0A4Y2G451_ARAVE|nr:hypothetical protein AVEN_138295-1 [Araneus ventricosus]
MSCSVGGEDDYTCLSEVSPKERKGIAIVYWKFNWKPEQETKTLNSTTLVSGGHQQHKPCCRRTESNHVSSRVIPKAFDTFEIQGFRWPVHSFYTLLLLKISVEKLTSVRSDINIHREEVITYSSIIMCILHKDQGSCSARVTSYFFFQSFSAEHMKVCVIEKFQLKP